MFFGKKKESNDRFWTHLTDESSLIAALESGLEEPVVIFKHSPRCSISSMALNRFEQSVPNLSEKAKLFQIDVVNDRPISQKTAELTGVFHQSPQVIVLKNGQVIHHNSHGSIDANFIIKLLQA